MTPPPNVRPLTEDDVPAAAAAGRAAIDSIIPPEFLPADDAARARTAEWMRRRVEHCRTTTPEGAFVAEADGGEIVGVALAIVREGIWGLSLLGVTEAAQGQRLGARLLQSALGAMNGCRGAIILSSAHPAAMRSYFRAGFHLKPCIAAAGALNRSRVPDSLRARPGDLETDRALVDAASRRVRGAAHGSDIDAMLRTGGALLVHDGGGFAVHRAGSPAVVAAADDAVAADLLWSCFAAAPPGETVHVDFMTEANNWAVQVVLDAGLDLTPDGPVYVRGETGPFAPYLPSGAYL
jgi:predicted N-acetyltransferase YhbS